MKLTSQPARTKLVFLLFGIVAFVIAIFTLRMNLYYERNYLGGVEALWHTNELFVFVQTNNTVEKVPRWNLLLSKFFGMWAANDRFTHEDVVVFHVRNDSLTEYRQEDFGITGQLIPIDDVPHLIRGGYEVQGFRWSGTQFTPITSDALNRIRSQQKPRKDFEAKTGWQKLDWEQIGNLNKEGDRSFPIGSSDLKAELHIKVTAPMYDRQGYLAGNPRVEITLGRDKSRHTLALLHQDFRRISKGDFERIVSRREGTQH
jgi:hypothetical protein